MSIDAKCNWGDNARDMPGDCPGDCPGDYQEQAALYMSGAMSAGERDAINARLAAGDSALRKAIAALDPAAQTMLQQIMPIDPDPAVRDRLLRRVSADLQSRQRQPAGASSAPPQPIERPIWRDWDDAGTASLFTLRASDRPWEPTGVDGVWVRRLFADSAANRMTAMFRMEPGTTYPQHVHGGAEECYVLQGDLHVGDMVLHAGDYQRAEAGSLHGYQSTDGGCLLLVTCALNDEHV